MKYFFIYDKFGIVGYTTSAETLLKFTKQRGTDNHHVIELDEKRMGKEFKDDIQHLEAMEMYGAIMFESEIEYFCCAMSQYVLDFKSYIKTMLDLLPNLKLTENEKLTLLEYFKIVKNKLEPLDDPYIGDIDYNDYLLMNVMLKSLIV